MVKFKKGDKIQVELTVVDVGSEKVYCEMWWQGFPIMIRDLPISTENLTPTFVPKSKKP